MGIDTPHRAVGAKHLAGTRPTLVFVRDARSGPSRRMDSLVAWVRVTRKRQLRVVDVEASSNPEVVELLDISVVPALALLNDGRVVGRLEGKATGDQIEELIRPYVEEGDVE
jgi:thioredoxin-like negative regulator of GroEL